MRWWRFNGVGLAGIGVQLASIWLLAERCGIRPRYATATAVLLAIGHNFLWHRRWTWADRPGKPLAAFARFATTNGFVSLVSNVAITSALVERFAIPIVAANLTAIGLSGVVNFVLADRLVFRSTSTRVRAVPAATRWTRRLALRTSPRGASHTSGLPAPQTPRPIPPAAPDLPDAAARTAAHRAC
jgi:putative flippase GtrA